jgi:hypothetical protein
LHGGASGRERRREAESQTGAGRAERDETERETAEKGEDGYEMSKPVSQESFARVVRTLAKMIVTAQKEAHIAQALARLASPAQISEEIRQQARQTIGQPFDELLRQLDESPDLDALAMLERFEGPIQ